MATPHVSAVAALMLEKKRQLVQSQVESILKSTALSIPAKGSQYIYDFDHFATVTWDRSCGKPAVSCDPVGSGLMLADQALNAVH